VKVRPGASRDEITGVREGALALRIGAPAREGAANESLVRFLGRLLGVAPSRVRVTRGDRSRDKCVEVRGLSVAVVRDRLGAAEVPGPAR
jgi:hypothetical protein